jgi:serine/threonine-protein kinase
MPAPGGQNDDTLAAGSILGRYEIGRLLGRGGMGAVYEATHRDLKKRVAIKVLSTALAGEEAKQRFLREGEAASRIQHPNVVDVTDVGVEGSLSYLVMEFLEGEDLAHRLARQGPMSPREIADVLLPVCAGLAIAHDEGVVHRDLKPENIFLVRQRHGGIEPKVLDFGISKLTGRDAVAMTGTLATFGTPYYMPPEQVRGARQADQRSDVYALGVVLYESVTGKRPFEAENIYSMLHAIGAGEYPPPRTARPGLPADVEAVIVRAMQLEPANRFPTVRHLAAALLPFASDKARVLYGEAFAGIDDGPGARPAAAPAPARTGDLAWAATATPAPGQGPFSSKSLPAAKETTLGSATGHQVETVPAAPRSRLGVVVGGSVAVGAVLFVAAKLLWPAPPPAAAPAAPVVAAPTPSAPAPPAPRATYRVEVDVDPTSATLELDGVATGAPTLRRDFALDGHAHRLVGRAPGYRDAAVSFTDAPPDKKLHLDPIPAAAEEKAPPAVETHAHAHHRQKAATPVAAPAPKVAAPPAAPEKPAAKSSVPVID